MSMVKSTMTILYSLSLIPSQSYGPTIPNLVPYQTMCQNQMTSSPLRNITNISLHKKISLLGVMRYWLWFVIKNDTNMGTVQGLVMPIHYLIHVYTRSNSQKDLLRKSPLTFLLGNCSHSATTIYSCIRYYIMPSTGSLLGAC